MTKAEQRKELEKAMENFKKPIKKVSKEDELLELSKGDYTDFSMRCGESGILPGYSK
jgi:hypothetical protein